MIAGSFLKKILISSWFLAGIPAILVMLFLPAVSSRYTLSVEPQQNNFIQFAYSDLNSDSISESIYSLKGIPYFNIVARDNDLHYYDQWNLPDDMDQLLSRFFFGNYDHDRFQEIYVFTHSQDSLFLNINEMLDSRGTKKERIFITKIGYIKGEVTSLLMPAGFFDEDGDGMEELYFSISAGFRTGPRKLYSYNIVSGILRASQFTGIISLNPKMADSDNDQRPEIFGVMSASGNYRTNVPYSDSSTWFMVFDDQLKFEFPPVEFPGFANALYINDYSDGPFRGYALLHRTGGTDTSVVKSQIMLFSTDGKLIRNRLLSDFSTSGSGWLFILHSRKSDRICILGDKIFETNNRLEIIKAVDLPVPSKLMPYRVDINNDGDDELLIYSEEFEKLSVYSGDIEKMAEFRIKIPVSEWRFSNYISKDHIQKLYLDSGGGYFLKLDRNNYYYLGYLTYPGIYLLFFLFILLVRRINTWQVEHGESLKRRLVTLQLQGIRAQLDPHFTFNTLNSIASLIYLEDRHTAYDYMNKFTHLLRCLLNDAERIYRSLAEELEFTTMYLELEKLRFNEKFNYTVEIGEGVSRKEQVPKLVLHTFAENAIKHGIMPRDKDGVLKIRIDRQNDYLTLSIEDNGIGRKRAEKNSTSSGKGLKLTGEFYDILNQINKKPIKYLIKDLYDISGNPTGTRVEVWVPVEDE